MRAAILIRNKKERRRKQCLVTTFLLEATLKHDKKTTHDW